MQQQNDLNAWLSANRLGKILDKLAEHDVITLDDLHMLENIDEIEAFAEEIGLSTKLKNRFIEKMMGLNDVQSESSSKEADLDTAHNEKHENQQQTNAIANDLKVWLSANRLDKIVDESKRVAEIMKIIHHFTNSQND